MLYSRHRPCGVPEQRCPSDQTVSLLPSPPRYSGACIYVGGQIQLPDADADPFNQEYYYWKFGAIGYERGNMNFTNTLIYSCRAGFKAWGFSGGRRPDVTLSNVEIHDTFIALAFFGQNQVQNGLFSAHTNNSVNAFPSYMPALGFQLYDTLFQTLFSNTHFRGYKGPGDIAFYQGSSSDCCSPCAMLGVSRTKFYDTPFDQRLQFDPDWNPDSAKRVHPWQWGNAQDIDGSLTGIAGGAMLGAADWHASNYSSCVYPDGLSDYSTDGYNETFEWFKIDDDCQLLFDGFNSRGYWACSRISPHAWATMPRTLVTIVFVNKNMPIGCQGGEYPFFSWARGCSGLTQTNDTYALEGTLYRFGREDRFAKFGWRSAVGNRGHGENAAKHVVGVCSSKSGPVPRLIPPLNWTDVDVTGVTHRPTISPTTMAPTLAPAWFVGSGTSESCDTTCAAQGRICSDDTLYSKAIECDSEQEINALRRVLYGSNCSSSSSASWLAAPMMTASGACYYKEQDAGSNKFSCSQASSWGIRFCVCDQAPYPTGEPTPVPTPTPLPTPAPTRTPIVEVQVNIDGIHCGDFNQSVFNLALDYLVGSATFSDSVCEDASGDPPVTITTHVAVPLFVTFQTSTAGIEYGSALNYVETKLSDSVNLTICGNKCFTATLVGFCRGHVLGGCPRARYHFVCSPCSLAATFSSACLAAAAAAAM